jgi:hypothetical protein
LRRRIDEFCWQKSMASYKKKRFREPESVENSIENVKKNEKIRGSAEKNRVGREPELQVFFYA